MDVSSFWDGLDDEARPFFEGLREGEVRLPWCDACDSGIWPPRTRCPRCYRAAGEHRALSGRGTVHTFSVVHRGEGEFAGRDPYVYAYVELDEGVTIPANVVGPGALQVAVGDRVRLVEDAAGDFGLDGAAFTVEPRPPH